MMNIACCKNESLLNQKPKCHYSLRKRWEMLRPEQDQPTPDHTVLPKPQAIHFSVYFLFNFISLVYFFLSTMQS